MADAGDQCEVLVIPGADRTRYDLAERCAAEGIAETRQSRFWICAGHDSGDNWRLIEHAGNLYGWRSSA